ncbi:MAG: pyridoxal-dependent decarboxylase, exosortase A system-associated [bacterium]
MSSALRSALAHFEQRDGEIIVGGMPISQVAARYGTPLYLYDRGVLHWRHRMLREKLPPDLKIYYAVKANPHHEVLRELGGLYDGVDVASKGEMVKAMAAGIAAAKMSFAGPGKGLDELRFAVENGIGTISVESEREIEHLRLLGEHFQKEVRVLMRINPAFELAKSGMKMGGGAKAFGMDSELIPALLQRWRGDQHVKVEGIHIYAGSQNLNADAILEAYHKILEYAIELVAATDFQLRIVNLGGGLGISYFAGDGTLDLGRIGNGLTEMLAQARPRLSRAEFRIELGRYIIGECGLYVCRVRYRKVSRGETFLVLDGGMNHHLAASGNFGQSFIRRSMPLTVANRLNGALEKVNVVGPLCTPLDTFGMNVELPHAGEKDLIVVMNSGAYGYSASPLGFLSHEAPHEVVL